MIQVLQPQAKIFSSTAGQALLTDVEEALVKAKTTILVDVQDVAFMDSSGLAMLIRAFKRVREAGGDLVLCSLSGQIQMLFEMTGLEKSMQIYVNQEDFYLRLSQTTPSELSQGQ